ncbi:MAG: hypothetical protein LLF94_01925 [Chlamydiales bacterium]|nr:hypothetical protein [Chlamydiales bacterium]
MSCCLKRAISEIHLNQEPILITDRLSLDEQVVKSLRNKMYSADSPEAVFEAIIATPVEHETLKTWCVNHYCEEAYDFIEDYKKWKKQSTVEGAKQIFKNYIMTDANTPIDVPPQYREKLIEALEANNRETTEIELQKCFDKVARELRGNFR